MSYPLSQYKAWTRNRINRQSFDTTKLTQFANEANRDIINTERWRFMEKAFVGSIAIGVNTYALPVDFQAAINFTLVDPDSKAFFVPYMPYETYDQRYPDPTAMPSGVPTCWTFFGNTLIVGPAKPDVAYTMQLRYYKSPVTMTADTDIADIPDDFAELMVLGMMARSLQSSDIYDQAQVIQEEWRRQMSAMQTRLQSRQFGAPLRMQAGRRRV